MKIIKIILIFFLLNNYCYAYLTNSNLKASNDITIKEAKETTEHESSEVHGETVNSKIGTIVPKKRPNQIGLGHEEKATVGLKYNNSSDIMENDLRKENGIEPRGRY